MRLRGSISSVLLTLGIFLVMSQAVLAQSDACPEVAGPWISGVGSKLTLRITGNTLSGFFERSGSSPMPLTGSVSPPNKDGNCPLSFSVSWPKDDNYAATVTSYTGRYQPRGTRITTIFLLVNPTGPTYASVSVGSDHFTRPTGKEGADKEQ